MRKVVLNVSMLEIELAACWIVAVALLGDGQRDDAHRGIGREPIIEPGSLDEAFVDPAVAAAGQRGVGLRRRERRQPPDRRMAALAIGPFELGHDSGGEMSPILYRID